MDASNGSPRMRLAADSLFSSSNRTSPQAHSTDGPVALKGIGQPESQTMDPDHTIPSDSSELRVSPLVMGNNSHGVPPTASEDELLSAARPLFDANRYISGLRDSLLLARSRAANQMQITVDKARHFEETLVALVDQFSLQNGEDMRRTPTRSFESMTGQLRVDQAVLSESTAAAVGCQSQISMLEYNLVLAEQHFGEVFSSFTDAIPGGRSAFAAGPKVLTESARALSPPPSIPDEARELFTKIGEVRLLEQEKLDTENEHILARSARDLARDQEREPSETDTDFEKQYLSTMSKLDKRLDDTQREADSWRLRCNELNLDLDALRYNRRAQDLSALPPTYDSYANSSAYDQHLQNQQGGVEDFPLSSDSPDGNVRDWLTSFSDDGLEVSQLDAAGISEPRRKFAPSVSRSREPEGLKSRPISWVGRLYAVLPRFGLKDKARVELNADTWTNIRSWSSDPTTRTDFTEARSRLLANNGTP